MKVIKYAAPALLMFALSGCETLEALDQTLKNTQINIPVPTPTQTPISDSLSKICGEAEKNAIRANDLYANKLLSVTGDVKLVTERYQPRYNVLLKVGKTSIHAGSEDKSGVARLNIDQKATVSGIIKDIDYDFNGCSISLKEATF